MADIVHRLSSLIKGRKRKVLDITVRLLCIFCCMPINLQSESMLKLVILDFGVHFDPKFIQVRRIHLYINF